MARVNERSQFYLPTTRLSTNRMSHCAFSPQPQRVIALWPVLISRPTEGRRLSWPVWLVSLQYARPKTIIHPIRPTKRPMMRWPGIELTTIESQVRRVNHYTIEPREVLSAYIFGKSNSITQSRSKLNIILPVFVFSSYSQRGATVY